MKHTYKRFAWPLLFVACLLVSAFVFYKRFPQNYKWPNFYAEDGEAFTIPLLSHSFFKTAFTPFNGYFIFGLYLLAEISRMVDGLFFRQSFTSLPQSIAIVSYLFLGFCASLPVLALRRVVRYEWLIFLTVISTLVPFQGWEYAIDGTIGNLKFAFVYIALLLILQRITSECGRIEALLICAGVTLCAYTNVTVYLMTPLLAVPILLDFLAGGKFKPVLIQHRRRLAEMAALFILLLPQVILVAVRGIPKLTGYMDQPFEAAKAVNVLLARPFLFGFLYWCYGSLNDLSTVLLLSMLLYWLWKKSDRRTLMLSVMTLATGLITTVLFAMNRTGVTTMFSNPYGAKGGGPAQFFYSQNWMAYLALTIFLSGLSCAWPVRVTRMRAAALIFLVIFVSVRSDFWLSRKERRNGALTIHSAVNRACTMSSGPSVVFPVYPKTTFLLTVPRTLACDSPEK